MLTAMPNTGSSSCCCKVSRHNFESRVERTRAAHKSAGFLSGLALSHVKRSLKYCFSARISNK